MSFQLIEGSGLPLAWHIRVTLEPSLTTMSLDKLMIFGGTVKQNEKCMLVACNKWNAAWNSEKLIHI